MSNTPNNPRKLALYRNNILYNNNKSMSLKRDTTMNETTPLNMVFIENTMRQSLIEINVVVTDVKLNSKALLTQTKISFNLYSINVNIVIWRECEELENKIIDSTKLAGKKLET